MVDKLGILEFMVLTTGGSPVFHYSRTDERKLDELLSGFLSAITSFASEFGEKSIQSLSFEGSELLYEQYGSDFLFIFLVESGASEKVLRAVLRELTRKFVSRYQDELKMEIAVLDVFMDFEKEVTQVFADYEEILLTMSNLSRFVVPTLEKRAMDIAIRSGGFLDEFHRDFGTSGNRVLEAIDGSNSIHRISLATGIPDDEIAAVVEYLAIRGFLKVAKMCPVIEGNDARFNAYLDLVGLPSKEFQLLERARGLCNGSRSLVEISEKLGVVPEQLYDVLEKLGDQVQWRLTEVAGLVE